MRADRFYQVTDAILAEALRQLLPVACSAPGAENRQSVQMPIIRAMTILEMWVKQGRGREALLQGEIVKRLPARVLPLIDDGDQGQILPEGTESRRSKREHENKRVRKG